MDVPYIICAAFHLVFDDSLLYESYILQPDGSAPVGAVGVWADQALVIPCSCLVLEPSFALWCFE